MRQQQLTPLDSQAYRKLKDQANNDVFAFRAAARKYAAGHPRTLRQRLDRLTTKDTSAYQLLNAWETSLAPEIDELQATRQAKALPSVLAKHLQLSTSNGLTLADQLIDSRLEELRGNFLNLHYGLQGRSRRAAANLITRPNQEIIDIKNSFTNHYLHQAAGQELGITTYDSQAKLLKRRRTKRQERRQVKLYRKSQAQRLAQIIDRQKQIKLLQDGTIARLLELNLEIVLVLDAYRTYKKRLEALKPASRTAAKTLSLFNAATKQIREDHAKTLAASKSVAAIQNSQQYLDDTLAAVFDMSDAGRNSILTHLKEYRELQREADKITKEQTDYPG